MELNQNHADIAWDNNLTQFDKAVIMRSFFMALYKPFDDLQASIKALFDERWLDSAKGKQLDGVGQILRQSRYVDFPIFVKYFGFQGQTDIGGFGEYRIKDAGGEITKENIVELDDDMYRRILYWRVAILTGSGTASDIRKAMTQILSVNDYRSQTLRAESAGNANLQIFIAVNKNTNESLLLNIKRWLPIAAGVGFNLNVTKGDKTFGFKEQGFYGFGKGIMAQGVL